MRLQGALDSEIHTATEKFVANGVLLDVTSLFNALQRSNSSIKRRPKKTIIASLERVVDFIKSQNGIDEDDSEAEIESKQPATDPSAELMNKSLRANLAGPQPVTPQISEDGSKRRAADGEAMPKRLKRSNEEKISSTPPEGTSLRDIGGMDDVLRQLTKLVIRPMQVPEVYHQLHLTPSTGVLLHGPPGCGKTMIARALAATIGKPFIELLGPSVVSGMSGESERAIRDRFEEAKKQAPCLMFIDEIDSIAPKRDASQSQMEKRMVAQLLVSMDELRKDPTKPVIVIAATNRPDSLDSALRRGGRFGSEINIGVPNEQVRKRILEAQTRHIPQADDIDFVRLAKLTAGFVGADLQDLVGKAGTNLVEKYCDALEQQAMDLDSDMNGNESEHALVRSIEKFVSRTNRHDLPPPAGFGVPALSMADFLSVLPTITPSSKREGFATVPDVSWKDIGALDKVREALQDAIVWPIQQPEVFEALGSTQPSGVLLWGPPGCGKTLLARAAAAESKANFISIKGPELLNKFVGESEAAVRKVFMRARSSVPCVIFFDELDALVPKRDEAGSEASSRVVNTLLTELDGLNDRAGIYVIAATNRPDVIDEAMLRPGRLGTILFVDVPGPRERVEIMRALVRTKPCDFTPEVEALILDDRCNGYSGADLSQLLRQGALQAARQRKSRIGVEELRFAVTQVKGSVQDARKYREMQRRFG